MSNIFLIEGFQGEAIVLERLSEMGFRTGTQIKIAQKMPFNGPYVIEMGNTHISLREEEFKCIVLKATK